MVDKKKRLEYGDKIQLKGTYIKPEIQRNYKGFDYSNYLKQLKIYGTIKCSKVEKIKQNQTNIMFQTSNKIKEKIIKNTKQILNEEEASVFLGLMLGYKNDIDENTQNNFRNASMAHILAVSGRPMTANYINFLRKVSIRIYDRETQEWLIPWVNENLPIKDMNKYFKGFSGNLEKIKEKQRCVLPLMKTNLRLAVVKN